MINTKSQHPEHGIAMMKHIKGSIMLWECLLSAGTRKPVRSDEKVDDGAKTRAFLYILTFIFIQEHTVEDKGKHDIKQAL